MATQNLTVSLDQDIIQKAKVVAAQRGTSVTRLVTEIIERLAGDEDAYQAAMREALETLDVGFHLGGSVRATREELHGRADLR